MIYSVCTVTKEETFEVIESFLKKNSGIFLENFINPLDGTNTNGTLKYAQIIMTVCLLLGLEKVG